jgi:hypothetical protein
MIRTLSNKEVTDCGPGGGCEVCDVCKRLNFLEWCSQAGGGTPHSIEENKRVDDYIAAKYPDIK